MDDRRHTPTGKQTRWREPRGAADGARADADWMGPGVLEAVLRQMSCGVIIAEAPSGRVLLANACCAQMFGRPVTAEQVSDYAEWPIYRGNERCPAEENPLARALEGEVVQGEELCVIDGGPLRVVRVDATPVRREDGEIAFAVASLVDITAPRRLREEVDALYQQAAGALRARDEFLSIAAHDLKTPITSMLLHIQQMLRNLERRGEGDPATGTFLPKLRSVERQAGRLTALVNDLLDASRISSGRLTMEPEELDLAALVREVVARQEPAATWVGSAITLRADVPVVGRWDRLRLEQVSMNLVSNAIKYGQGKPIEIDVRAEGPRAVITVHDHGVGIDPAHHERIFERFERAGDSRAFAGLGLGLWIVRRILSTMDGTITVDSHPGDGATFRVELPLEQGHGEGSRGQDGGDGRGEGS